MSSSQSKFSLGDSIKSINVGANRQFDRTVIGTTWINGKEYIWYTFGDGTFIDVATGPVTSFEKKLENPREIFLKALHSDYEFIDNRVYDEQECVEAFDITMKEIEEETK